MPVKPDPCPCGGASYSTCCARFHADRNAPDAQRLMRSRYSAYALGRYDYLRETWHASTRPVSFEAPTPPRKWLGLSIRSHRTEGDRATVEFVARYRIDGRGQRLHEVSRFVCEDGRWYYLDGERR